MYSIYIFPQTLTAMVNVSDSHEAVYEATSAQLRSSLNQPALSGPQNAPALRLTNPRLARLAP